MRARHSREQSESGKHFLFMALNIAFRLGGRGQENICSDKLNWVDAALVVFGVYDASKTSMWVGIALVVVVCVFAEFLCFVHRPVGRTAQ